tara:strand:- start:40121 stop:41212 length:1092 start_codon:yes stop_codon:yes gene_type:complete
MKTIVTITGIRPDFIRMCEIFKKLDKNFNHILIHTGQHYDNLLSDVFFKDLNIRKPDYNLGIGGGGKQHYHQQAELGVKIIELFESEDIKPDIVLFLGDSNSVLASLPLKKEGYKIGHIEAGMRSYDERMLEEINRKACDHVSDYLFVYHENYKEKALKENINSKKIFVVGNTIVEALNSIDFEKYDGDSKHICMDIHRPENFKYKGRMEVILDYANQCSDKFNLPVKMLKFGRTLDYINEYKLDLGSIELVDLMGYKDFINFQQQSLFIISDSGTAQEEPALLDIPVIVPRSFTERPESVKNGNSFMFTAQRWVNGDPNDEHIEKSFEWLENYFNGSDRNSEWLGDGDASDKIISILKGRII